MADSRRSRNFRRMERSWCSRRAIRPQASTNSISSRLTGSSFKAFKEAELAILRPEFGLRLHVASDTAIVPLEPITFADLAHAFVDHVGIWAAQKGCALVAFFITA